MDLKKYFYINSSIKISPEVIFFQFLIYSLFLITVRICVVSKNIGDRDGIVLSFIAEGHRFSAPAQVVLERFLIPAEAGERQSGCPIHLRETLSRHGHRCRAVLHIWLVRCDPCQQKRSCDGLHPHTAIRCS